MDDDPSIRRGLYRLLRSAGLSVEVFAGAAELLARELPVHPACLVLDVHLSGTNGHSDTNGLDVLRRIHAADSSLPVLVVSGDTDPRLRERALRAGATAFLLKPLDEERLLEEIHRALPT